VGSFPSTTINMSIDKPGRALTDVNNVRLRVPRVDRP
jgi:hypothetical protein